MNQQNSSCGARTSFCSFGELLKTYRLKRGLLQREVGDTIKRGFRTVSNYERNTVMPSLENLKALIGMLNISSQDLKIIYKKTNNANIIKKIEELLSIQKKCPPNEYSINHETLGKLLRSYRLKRGFSQREVGDAIKRGFRAVSKYEHDIVSPPHRILDALVKMFDVSPQDLGVIYKKTNDKKPKGENVALGSIIEKARKGKGLSQKKVARMLNKSPRSVQFYERGLIKPNLETLNMLVKNLEIPPENIKRFMEHHFVKEPKIKMLGNLIKRARLKKNLTQEEVGGMIKKDKKTIQYYESDRWQPSQKSMHTFELLVEKLDISLQEINKSSKYASILQDFLKMNYMKAETLGQLIKLARYKKNLMQKELAARINLCVESLRSYEYDRLKPSQQTLKIIVQELSISPELVNRFLDYDIREYLDITSREIKDFSDRIGIKISDLELIINFFEWGDPSEAISELAPESYSNAARIIVSKIITGQNYNIKSRAYSKQSYQKRIPKDPTKRTAFISLLLQDYGYGANSTIVEHLKRKALNDYRSIFTQNKEKTLQILEDKIFQLNGSEPLLKETLQYVYSTLKEQSQVIPLNNAARYVTAVKVAE